MKSILCGFPDDSGRGPLSVFTTRGWVKVGQTPQPDEALRVISEIKRLGDYPKKIVRIELCPLQPKSIGIKVQKVTDRAALEKTHAEARAKAEADALANRTPQAQDASAAKARAEAEKLADAMTKAGGIRKPTSQE